MRISALAPWYGSKRTLAPEIVRQLGPHRCYWEPFCGSCAVLLAKPQVTYETVNDLHEDLVNLARVLQDEGLATAMYGRVSRTLFCESFCSDAKERVLQPIGSIPDAERAYWYLVFSWFHLNGIAGTKLNHTGNFCARYSAKGGNGATRWRSVVESIPWWHERLRGVQILHRDAFEILERIDDATGTAIYVDPPYLVKGAKYVHDFDLAEPRRRSPPGPCRGQLPRRDHGRLAELLRRFRRARVVVSYYEDPRLSELYPTWRKLDVAVAKSMVNGGMRDQRGRVDAPEVLLVNGGLVSETLF